jgi:hypothetical protein
MVSFARHHRHGPVAVVVIADQAFANHRIYSSFEQANEQSRFRLGNYNIRVGFECVALPLLVPFELPPQTGFSPRLRLLFYPSNLHLTGFPPASSPHITCAAAPPFRFDAFNPPRPSVVLTAPGDSRSPKPINLNIKIAVKPLPMCILTFASLQKTEHLSLG